MEAIVKARVETNEVRKMARNQDAVAEERRLAAEERRVAAEERKVTLEERKVSNEERAKLLEWEKHLFFMDTSNLNAARPKKGKTSAKKNKAADGSGGKKARGKKLAGRSTAAAATEAPASSLIEPAADAHHVFDEMPPR